MNFKRWIKIMLISLIMISGTALINIDQLTINAQTTSSQTQLIKAVKKSGQKLSQIGLKGKWYSLTKRSTGNANQVIIFGQDGSLDWGIEELPSNNTMVTQVAHYHGWYRLSVRYPNNSYVYGFVKKTLVKVHHKKHVGIYFVISNHKIPRKLKSVTVATHSKVILKPNQALKNFQIK